MACGGADVESCPLDELVKDTVVVPVSEVAVDGLPGRVVVREVAPGDTRPVDVQDGIEDAA